MPKGLEHDALDPWVLQLVGDALARGGEAASVVSEPHLWRGEDAVTILFGGGLQHGGELRADVEDAWV